MLQNNTLLLFCFLVVLVLVLVLSSDVYLLLLFFLFLSFLSLPQQQKHETKEKHTQEEQKGQTVSEKKTGSNLLPGSIVPGVRERKTARQETTQPCVCPQNSEKTRIEVLCEE